MTHTSLTEYKMSLINVIGILISGFITTILIVSIMIITPQKEQLEKINIEIRSKDQQIQYLKSSHQNELEIQQQHIQYLTTQLTIKNRNSSSGDTNEKY
ncbi:hypothetical protein HWV00_15680 [Moritella sp. 24]|uniref:hypothetical protein n=1 Tax=Moritella sp. 24 TaxID=2746230 RepID=UPI001BAB07FB|nr:hypothetical protein [Moritella sp. 24]QUM77536.1 hypothetical protein HWV00_15680 [Moritella sp. 24]